MEKETPFILDFTKLSEQRRNPSTGKVETVLIHDVIDLAGVGRSITYHKGRNEYFAGHKTKAFEGEALEKALDGVRWKFSKLNGTKDEYPPSPENIEIERKKAILALTEGGRIPSPEQVAAVYAETSPTHIDPVTSKAKALHAQLENAEHLIVSKFLRS
jgi:hypothetical protein